MLTDRVAIVTGASQGLGLAIAEHLVDAGATVAICARTETAVATAVAGLRERAGDDGRIIGLRADIGVEADVDALVAHTLERFGRIDILVNNAGIYGPMGSIEDIDWAEWVDAIRINLLGLVYISRAVVPHMKARRSGKIISLSGGGATNPLPGISAYAASKAAVVRFVETLALEAREFGIDVNAIAPGALNTRLLDQVLAAGPDKVGAGLHDRMTRIRDTGGTPLSVGAELVVYLASAASDGITGRLIAAQWDPWHSLQDHRADLDGSDVYTLRRIVPADRGMIWGEEDRGRR